MKKNVFIAYIEQIDDHFIGFLCDDIKNNKIFAEDHFGNFCTIENGIIISHMLEYEPEEYKIANSLDDFYNKYPLYDIDEAFKVLDEINSSNRKNEKNYEIITDLDEAKAVIGKDFIDLTYVVNDNKYNATAAYNNNTITIEELKKIENFNPKYFKEAKKVNNDKKANKKGYII